MSLALQPLRPILSKRGSETHPQLLSGAQNVTIHGGTFATVGGHMIINRPDRPGLKLLIANITQNAFHDAAERADPPKCHPHTRVAIREGIMHWIKDTQARQKFIIWLNGAAGSGKTAISQSIADACAEEGLLAASFFFGRTAAGRNTSSYFIATLAYQLSKSIPEIEDELLNVIEKDPTIFSRSLSTQIRMLVIQPLTSVQLTSLPRFVVVDGIDECGPDDQAQAGLLNALGAAVDQLKNVAMIFLISSRPEYAIRTAFQNSIDPLSSLTKSLVLDDRYRPDDDILSYLKSEFHKIQLDQLPLTSEPWPAENDVDLLVKKASGQFIFAATIIRFIDSPRDNPIERLNIILGLSSPGNTTPFALLDALYCHILASVADIEKVLNILTLMMLQYSWESSESVPAISLSVPVAYELLNFDVRRALVDMHALVFVPLPTDNQSELRIHHVSLYDFLMDRSRSHDYCVDKGQAHGFLSRRWLKVITNYHHNSHISKNFPLRNQVQMFMYHYRKSPFYQLDPSLAMSNFGGIFDEISHPVQLYAPPWLAFFTTIERESTGPNDTPIFSTLQGAFDDFVIRRISKYPAHLQPYIPMIFLQGLSTNDIEELCHIVLYGLRRSAWEFGQIYELDSDLLGLLHDRPVSFDRNCNGFLDFFQSKRRARRHYMDRGRYVALARRIIEAVCPMPGDVSYRQVRIEGIDDRHFDYLRKNLKWQTSGLISLNVTPGHDIPWFTKILSDASVDLDLAWILHERALQYNSETQVPILGRWNRLTWEQIAEASLDYIRRCDILYGVHTHLPETTSCIVCSNAEDAVLVDEKWTLKPPDGIHPDVSLAAPTSSSAAKPFSNERNPQTHSHHQSSTPMTDNTHSPAPGTDCSDDHNRSSISIVHTTPEIPQEPGYPLNDTLTWAMSPLPPSNNDIPLSPSQPILYAPRPSIPDLNANNLLIGGPGLSTPSLLMPTFQPSPVSHAMEGVDVSIQSTIEPSVLPSMNAPILAAPTNDTPPILHPRESLYSLPTLVLGLSPVSYPMEEVYAPTQPTIEPVPPAAEVSISLHPIPASNNNPPPNPSESPLHLPTPILIPSPVSYNHTGDVHTSRLGLQSVPLTMAASSIINYKPSSTLIPARLDGLLHMFSHLRDITGKRIPDASKDPHQDQEPP